MESQWFQSKCFSYSFVESDLFNVTNYSAPMVQQLYILNMQLFPTLIPFGLPGWSDKIDTNIYVNNSKQCLYLQATNIPDIVYYLGDDLS